MTCRLLDRELRVGSFAETHAYAPLLVADDDCCGEIETTTACHHARDTTNADELLCEFGTLALRTATAATRASSWSSTATLSAGTTIVAERFLFRCRCCRS